MQTKALTELTFADFVPVERQRDPYPRSSFKGYMKDAKGHGMGSVHVVNGEVHVTHIASSHLEGLMVGGPFRPDQFERAGWEHITQSKSAKCWRFKKEA
jgi:hypothetical protein